MAYERKTRDEWHIECNYGYGDGWECEAIEGSFKEARQRRKEYRENSPYPVRIIKRRVPLETVTK